MKHVALFLMIVLLLLATGRGSAQDTLHFGEIIIELPSEWRLMDEVPLEKIMASDSLTYIGEGLPPTHIALQDPLFMGDMMYEVTTIFDANSWQYGAELKKRFKLSFNPKYYRAEQLGEGPNNFSTVERGSGYTRLFTNYFGHHFELIDTTEETEEGEEDPMLPVEQTEETRTILGFPCRRVMIKHPEGVYEAWVTTEIRLNYPSNFPGCALEFTVPFSRGIRRYTLKAFAPRIVYDEEFIVKGYEKVTESELRARFLPETVKRD